MMDPAGSSPTIINIAVIEIDSLPGANDVVIQNNRMYTFLYLSPKLSSYFFRVSSLYKLTSNAALILRYLIGNCNILKGNIFKAEIYSLFLF